MPEKQQAPRTPVQGQYQRDGSTARASKRTKLEDRIKAEERFRYKYTKAFPGFKFYLDSLEPTVKSSFSQRVTALGAVRNSSIVDVYFPNVVVVLSRLARRRFLFQLRHPLHPEQSCSPTRRNRGAGK